MEKRERKRRLIVAVFFLGAYFLAGNSFCAEGDVSGQLRLLIEMDKAVYRPEEPIYLKCRIENVTEAIVLLYPIVYDDLQIFVKHEDERRELPLGSRIFPLEMVLKEHIVRLQPAASISFEWTINKRFYHVPQKTGKYKLYTVYSNKSERLEGVKLWTGELKSNIVEFEIK